MTMGIKKMGANRDGSLEKSKNLNSSGNCWIIKASSIFFVKYVWKSLERKGKSRLVRLEKQKEKEGAF
jgi:hypothetical protein